MNPWTVFLLQQRFALSVMAESVDVLVEISRCVDALMAATQVRPPTLAERRARLGLSVVDGGRS